MFFMFFFLPYETVLTAASLFPLILNNTLFDIKDKMFSVHMSIRLSVCKQLYSITTERIWMTFVSLTSTVHFSKIVCVKSVVLLVCEDMEDYENHWRKRTHLRFVWIFWPSNSLWNKTGAITHHNSQLPHFQKPQRSSRLSEDGLNYSNKKT